MAKDRMAEYLESQQKAKQKADDRERANAHRYETYQIVEQANEIMEFLSLIHPGLSDRDDKFKPNVEIRPVDRYGKTRFDSYTTYTLVKDEIPEGREEHRGKNGRMYSRKVPSQPSSRVALAEYLQTFHGSVAGCCLYYSLFSFFQTKEDKEKRASEPYPGGYRINVENSMFTYVLPADFDDCTHDEFEKAIRPLRMLGIEFNIVFTGHGYQMLILLDKPCRDKGIFTQFTNLLRQKGFNVDPKIKDASRIFRLPHTFNCKGLDPAFPQYYPGDVIPTEWVEKTHTRYDINDIFERINLLKDSPIVDADVEAKIGPTTVKTESVKREFGEICIKAGRRDYEGLIDFKKLPAAIELMLKSGAVEGLRYQSRMCMIPYLRNTLGLNQDQIVDILAVWGGLCSPPLDRDFIEDEVARLWRYSDDGKRCGRYTEQLRAVYGPFSAVTITKANDQVCIPNFVLLNAMSGINDTAFKIYLHLAIDHTRNQNVSWTKADVLELSGVSDRTFDRSISDLVNKRVLRVVKDSKIYTYEFGNHVKKVVRDKDLKLPSPDNAGGYTIFNAFKLDMALSRLSGSAIKVYLEILRISEWNNGADVYVTQGTIGKSIGNKKAGTNINSAKTQQRVSQLTDELHKYRFIQKITEPMEGNPHLKKSTYRIL